MTEVTDPKRLEQEFAEADRLAEAALGHARKHGSPPRPNVYAVWYTYATGTDKALSERLDSALTKDGAVDLGTIEQIYEEHFLQRRLSSGMTRIGEELESELTETLRLIRDGLGSNRAYVGSLKKAQDQIGMLGQNNKAKKLLMPLVDASQDHVAETETVGAELIRARAQVEDLKRELNLLRDSAYLDHLTQIANRRHMDDVLEREIAEARRSATPLCFALGDLDHFKALNDGWGHQIGDALLKHFAALIRKNVKGQDTPARYGGEEFAIIFPRTALFGAGHVVDRIRQLLNETEFVRNGDQSPIGRVSVSFGVTQLRPGDDSASLVRRADILLYAAKRKGRNRVETDM
jgi:diguanylate cyclase